jgi:hypothetical protein
MIGQFLDMCLEIPPKLGASAGRLPSERHRQATVKIGATEIGFSTVNGPVTVRVESLSEMT